MLVPGMHAVFQHFFAFQNDHRDKSGCWLSPSKDTTWLVTMFPTAHFIPMTCLCCNWKFVPLREQTGGCQRGGGCGADRHTSGWIRGTDLQLWSTTYWAMTERTGVGSCPILVMWCFYFHPSLFSALIFIILPWTSIPVLYPKLLSLKDCLQHMTGLQLPLDLSLSRFHSICLLPTRKS